jgi:N-acetylglucosaminyldiphosphoundecaprenol N-acetyl-beta-D-mannosaminyltransferase
VDVFGVPIASLRLAELLEYIRLTVRRAGHPHVPFLIGYANAHTCNMLIENEDYRRAIGQVDLVYADGNGPRLAAWLSGSWLPPRMTGADWIYDLCQLCSREGFRLFFLGAGPGIAEEAAKRLCARFPDLSVVGALDGFFSPEQQDAVLDAIRRAAPDILILGMGTPRQELWMAQQKRALEVPVIWGAGGAFDYASGRLPRPPRWMRSLALEWLGRMLIEPQRLGLRYLVGLPVFMARAVRQGLFRRR